MNILVAYDGSLNSQSGLRYGMRKLKDNSGRLMAVHIFNNNMFIDYALPGAEAAARRESLRYLEDARNIIAEFGEGLRATAAMREGNPEEEIINISAEETYDLIIAPPGLKSIVRKAPCRVSVIPGYILVPIEKLENFNGIVPFILDEARASGSKVLLLGIVPIHMYSVLEKRELDNVRKEVSATLMKAKKILAQHEIQTEELSRSGYPDEEIVQTAARFPITLIALPGESEIPSELGKAADMLLDEFDKFRHPIFRVPSDKYAY